MRSFVHRSVAVTARKKTNMQQFCDCTVTREYCWTKL